MKFIDEAIITVQSGKGGPGCVSFRREKYVPRGGPDGGDGGKGGDVILHTTNSQRTLQQFQFKRIFKAANGSPGQGQNKIGKSGADLIIDIPPGTVIYNNETRALIKDTTTADERILVAKGGRGGQGNARFKTSRRQTPRFAQPGEPGETVTLQLELKLLADVGLVGLPNAGKSTLISVISAARPRIADYPFTTLSPCLGVVQFKGANPFVVADIPGLIEGAHKGVGLGIRFLRHIERTRLLVHLIDAAAIDPDDPLGSYRIINNELSAYGSALAAKPQIVVLNKLDLPEARANLPVFKERLADPSLMTISAATGDGVNTLISRIMQTLDNLDV